VRHLQVEQRTVIGELRRYVAEHLQGDGTVQLGCSRSHQHNLPPPKVRQTPASSSLRGARKRLGGFESADCHPLYGPKGSRPS
jgi:hypothetical protein